LIGEGTHAVVVVAVILGVLVFFFMPVLSARGQGRAAVLKAALAWWGGLALLVAIAWAKYLIAG
jgi:hypothetical protein